MVYYLKSKSSYVGNADNKHHKEGISEIRQGTMTKNYSYSRYNSEFETYSIPETTENPTRSKRARRIIKKQKSKVNYVFIGFCIIASLLISVPANKIVWNTFVNNIKNKAVNYKITNQDFSKSQVPFFNTTFLNKTFLADVNVENPEMKTLELNQPMTRLTQRLENLASMYPNIEPGIFIWDYETGNYVDINAEKEFPTASTIKIPILVQYFRRIEQGRASLDDTFQMTPYFRTGGSGYLQCKPDKMEFDASMVARLMIQESDNSATNMILSTIGGVNEMNMAFRQWGFSQSHLTNWLPDLYGENVATPKDMGTIVYNINNPEFLNLQSRAKIVEMMSNVRNRSLIRSGIPDNAKFIHKTGDIGNMLGDIGMVSMPNGRKFIVAIMVKRPWNSPSARTFIQNSSKIIYNSFASNDL